MDGPRLKARAYLSIFIKTKEGSLPLKIVFIFNFSIFCFMSISKKIGVAEYDCDDIKGPQSSEY